MLAAATVSLRSLARLVVPVSCAGCGLDDVPLCARCGGALDGAPWRAEADAPRLDRLDGVPPLPVWALGVCTGSTRETVVAWKDRDRADLDRVLGDAVRRAAVALAPDLRVASAGRVTVVPAPSSPGSRRRRGREPTAVLAAAVADGLRSAGVPAAVAGALVRRRRTADQAGLSARARGANLLGAVAVRRRYRAAVPSAGTCLLVDDVLTTGATLAAAERVLEAAGAAVVGALVLAATPPPGTVTPSARDAGDASGSPDGHRGLA